MSSDSESCNMVKQRPILRIWEGDFGVPTIDPDSLRIWTYLKINKIEFDVEVCSFPFLKPIPSLIVGSKIFNGIKTIWDKLQRMKSSNTDKKYSVMEQSRIMAYVSYVFECLETATNINLWVNERNYINFTRTWYRTAIYFPFNYIHIKKIKDRVDKHIAFLARDVSIEEFSKLEYEKAQKCMSDLSVLLGDKTYFMGTYPTTLDAYVFGYLCLLLNAPFPDNTLQNILKGFPNLVQYVHYVSRTYFPDVKEENKYIKKKTPTENEEEVPTKMVVVAGIFAFTAMFAYATMIGQFKIQK
ncbi:metaxin-1-like [Agrilus planipennis]|uniref:Metaxin-1-like n=1 Tax=Agrilus planipennis TaxID=224129 RepID=A0A1W4X0X4_AGRPL|nr:metaxin-1-like [Agrilus planipennis]